MNDSIHETVDVNLYVYTIQLLTSDNNVNSINAYFQLLTAKVLSPNFDCLKITTKANILNALLIYTYPLNIPLQDITNLARLIIYSKQIENESKDEDYFDLEEFSLSLKPTISNTVSLRATANELLVDTNIKCQSLGKLDFDATSDDDELFLSFIRAKSFHLSQFYQDVNDILPLFENVSFPKFNAWYRGIILPYKYYYSHFGLAYSSNTFNGYLAPESLYPSRLHLLLAPLKTGKVLNNEGWFENVIFPIVKYYGNDLCPLNEWLFDNESGYCSETVASVVRKYQFWRVCLKCIHHHFESKDYEVIINSFLSACYFYGFKEDADTVSTIELVEIYDLIIDTLTLFDTPPPTHGLQLSDINYNNIPFDCVTLKEFQTATNPISPLFQVEAIAFLKQVIETCQKLLPINRLTIKKYFQLKYENKDMDTKREILKITNNINGSNWKQLLNSIALFQKNFIRNERISATVVERLLLANLFDVVDEVYFEKRLGDITVNELYDVVLDKFWDCLNHANSLNDKSGSLHNAELCLKLFDKLALEKDLGEDNHRDIVKFKHLFKAINALKRFKILNRNQPYTPQQLIINFANGNLLKLINIVLEQNPKSYLAFDKLYRILNDMMLFYNDDNHKDDKQHSHNYYFNKLKTACIESALIDNNFNYAYKQSLELFDYLQGKKDSSQIDDLWLTFYQVGKYVSPQWFENSGEQIDFDILIKQREILSLTILNLQLKENSKVVLAQWSSLNAKIQRHSLDNNIETVKKRFDNENWQLKNSKKHLENIGNLATEIISDASKTTNNASEKLSNLFVSGLGWAIGANQQS
ncbi:protein transport protein, putative [Candida dubliniensis CD36]|uniref:Protein transport protein, putative n=1 Tax=Candida dubliniensis (strain CD36 / ATCC MYA-646 / CBS 7987 / NCPF 3949 / NRRL Y-17841) TaxID=573826 RepID=B9WMD6_CANDC|nr:protein transport protein, putative [Candida dubliniensis CD36]CAX40249.1 protein transport protein, putative [Candida dubliniensis CD36]